IARAIHNRVQPRATPHPLYRPGFHARIKASEKTQSHAAGCDARPAARKGNSMSPLRKVRPLTNDLVNEMQQIISSVELDDLQAALKSIKRARLICDELHSEIVNIIRQQRLIELRAARKKGRKK